MAQDFFNLNYLAKELNCSLKNAKVNKIVQPNKEEVVLYLYVGGENKKLVISVNPQLNRVSFTNLKKEAPLVPYNFCMLLRKHLLNAIILKIEAIHLERIIKIDFLSKNELFEENLKSLYVEVMGKYANIILTENNKILGAIKNAGTDILCKRPLLSGLTYTLPAPQEKLDFSLENLQKLLSSYLTSDYNILDGAKHLFENLKGIAYQTATYFWAKSVKHIQSLNFNFETDSILNLAINVANFINNLAFNDVLEPSIQIENNAYSDVSFYKLNNNAKQFNSLNEAITTFYEFKEENMLFSSLQNKLKSAINTKLKKVQKRLNTILEKEDACSRLEENKVKGELLISYAYLVPKKSKSVNLVNYYDNSEIEIKLDESLTAQQNAELYFKRYKKEKRTKESLSMQKEEVLLELDYLKGLITDIEVSQAKEELDHYEYELYEEGIIKKPKEYGKKEKSVFYREYLIDGFKVLVGRNNIENEQIVRKANKNDLWLHAKSYHSAHVIISSGDRVVDSKTILKCAQVCAYYSGGRYGGKIEIDYTKKKNLKKPPKSKNGYYIYTDYQTVVVDPNRHFDLLVQDKR